MFVIVFYINSILDMSFLSLSIEVLVGILCYILAILCLKPTILIMVTKYLKR